MQKAWVAFRYEVFPAYDFVPIAAQLWFLRAGAKTRRKVCQYVRSIEATLTPWHHTR
jgi:hypothetical protein